MTGTLHLAWDRRPRLEFIGQLQAMDVASMFGSVFAPEPSYPLLLGRTTDRRLVSLWGATSHLRQVALDDPDGAHVEVMASKALVGAHGSEADARFRKVRLRLERLLDWIDGPLIEHSWEFDEDRLVAVSHRSSRVPARSCQLPGARLDFGLATRESGDKVYFSRIDRWAEAVVTLGEPLSADECHARYVVPLMNLLTFVTGKASAVEYVGLVPADADDASEAELVWRRPPPADEAPRPVTADEILFTLADLPGDASDALRRWLRASETLEDIINLFLGPRYAPTMFEQNRFLNLVQAAEALHRELHGEMAPVKAKDRERHDALLDASPPEHREWLAKELNRSERYTFVQRLRGLIDDDPWLVPEVMPNRGIVGKVRDARNFHTHWDAESAPRALRGFDLWPLNEMLIVLLEARFLDQLGFDEAKRRELIVGGSAAYRALKLNPDAVQRLGRKSSRGPSP